MTKQQNTYQNKSVTITGAKMHNLKNVNVSIPRNQFVVITGLSGSGKSSLAFDTLFAEGQRRYVESLSSYARQFLGRLEKPDVESIKGISPAIAIEQKVTSRSSRSTVGTQTEIYDYIKLLYARAGRTYSPISGEEVKKDSVTDVVNFCNSFSKGTKAMLFSPIEVQSDRGTLKTLEILKQQGFSRVQTNGGIEKIDELIEQKSELNFFNLLIDRFVVDQENEENISRIADSTQTAFFEGKGKCSVHVFDQDNEIIKDFSNLFELDGIQFEPPSVHFFTFNNPVGACKKCEGFGSVLGIDADLVIPNKNLSVYEDAIVCWKGEKMQEWKNELIYSAEQFDFPIHKAIGDLTDEQYQLLWRGNRYFAGLNTFFKHLEKKSYKIQHRVMLSRYRGKTVCPECNGTRLRNDANYVKIGNKSISELVLMPIEKLYDFFKYLNLNEHDQKIADRLLVEINSRLHFLLEVGLSYLTLNRLSSTLSGGESQRINLATSLGSSLVGSMYILDEPSIGLHPRDTQRLIKVLKALKEVGNTVIIVEHDDEIMKAADHIIDMGPMAGINGGEVVFEGTQKQLLKANTLTAKYLTGRKEISTPSTRRNWNRSITISGAKENNLKNIDIEVPLNILTVITGVSGSGKSTFVKNILYPALKKAKGESISDKTGDFKNISGDIEAVNEVIFIDQNPIGKSSRSNPVTYVKAYDEIRTLFSRTTAAKHQGLKPAHFSFNVAGGRCDNCDGEGQVTIEMQFMADVHLTCDVCKGKRFKEDILEVKYQGKNIYEILQLTIDEAIAFFDVEKPSAAEKKLITKLLPLQKVGLGYMPIGQASNTISGGEAQRIKLAYFLGKGATSPKTLFIFDEPTTGLHFDDVRKLLISFNELIKLGHSLLVIEHNLDVVKTADWVIDLGPEGGENGGELVFAGVPEDLIKTKKSYTGKYLKL